MSRGGEKVMGLSVWGRSLQKLRRLSKMRGKFSVIFGTCSVKNIKN